MRHTKSYIKLITPIEQQLLAILSYPMTRISRDTSDSRFAVERDTQDGIVVLARGSSLLALVSDYNSQGGKVKYYKKLRKRGTSFVKNV